VAATLGVLLFNLGGPPDQQAVEPFLVELFSDRDIIELPLGAWAQPYLARLIARLRGPSVRRNYARIGGGSPQLRLTQAQATALQARLNQGGDRFQVEVGMRYSAPRLEDALRAFAAVGIRRLVTLTLFPHYSKATTGSSQLELRRALALPRWRAKGFETSSIDSYPDLPLYVDAMTDTVRRALLGFPAARRDEVVLLFSAHGLPQSFVDAGDPYLEHVARTRQAILDRLRVKNRQLLGYQSRTGPVKWTGPGTDKLIDQLAREGVKEVLVVPLSFVSDHIETLYEVDLLFGERARRRGIRDFRRSESLNTHPLFIEALAHLVFRHLGEPTPRA
jgi:ferrochelatase